MKIEYCLAACTVAFFLLAFAIFETTICAFEDCKHNSNSLCIMYHDAILEENETACEYKY